MSRKPFCPQRSGIYRVTPSYDWSSFCCFSYFIVWISSSWELTGMETPWALIFWGMRDHNPSLSPGHICLGRSVYGGIAGLSSPVSSSQHVHQLCAAPLPHGLYGWEVAHRPMHPATTRVIGERDCRSWARGLGWETEESWGQWQRASLAFNSWALTSGKKNINLNDLCVEWGGVGPDSVTIHIFNIHNSFCLFSFQETWPQQFKTFYLHPNHL